jgi:signal transduction histidine kinase
VPRRRLRAQRRLENALGRPGADLPSAIRDALSRGDHLRTPIDDLVCLIRPGPAAGPADIAALADDVRARWEAPLATRGRRLVLVAEPDLPRCTAPAAAIRQILDVVIGNALWHGEGTVAIAVRAGNGDLVVEVSDEGQGLAGDPAGLLDGSAAQADGHGRGLPLARSLAAAAGGSLAVRRAAARFQRAVPPLETAAPAVIRPGPSRSGNRDRARC